MSHFVRALPTFWQKRSLRFWLALAIALATLPMVILTTSGYLLYFQRIAEPLRQVISQQGEILQPLQTIEIALWNASSDVNEFVADGESTYINDFYNAAADIERRFGNLALAFAHNGMPVTDIQDLRTQWGITFESVPFIFWNRDTLGTRDYSNSVKMFENSLHKIATQIGNIHDELSVQNQRTHSAALKAQDRFKKLAATALALFVALILLGIEIIDRSLVSSMNKLTEGALRIAKGDHDHRVEVVIPRELVSVAEAFNTMTKQILAQEKELEKLATTDGLTGLLNHREFDKILKEEIQRAERYHSAVSLILIDIDHFKHFNDTFGHQGGDEALRRVANVMGDVVRAVDKAFRYGGEEFAVILPESDLESAVRSAERIRNAVSNQKVYLREDAVAHLTISLGVASYPASANISECLIKAADEALYASKNAGRNRVSVAKVTSDHAWEF